MLRIRLTRAVRSRFIFHRNCTSSPGKITQKHIRMANQQPAWTIPPRQADEPVLKVYNSLTRSKVRLDWGSGIVGEV